jgi:hypothetical protein
VLHVIALAQYAILFSRLFVSETRGA